MTKSEYRGHLIVASQMRDYYPNDEMTSEEGQKFYQMVLNLKQHVPTGKKIFIAQGQMPSIKESAIYMGILGAGLPFGKEIRGLDSSVLDEGTLDEIIEQLKNSTAYTHNVLAVVTTMQLSGILNGIHAKGTTRENLRSGQAYLTDPDGVVFKATYEWVKKL